MTTKVTLDVIDPAILDRANQTGTQPISTVDGLQDELDAMYAAAVDAKTSNYTVMTADNGKVITMSASGGNRTVTLPPAATVGSGFRIIVRKIDGTNATVTVDGNAAETIDGAATKVLRLQYQSLALVCDGTAWHSIGAGGIFEEGSNANGDYTKFAGGLMICRKSTVGTLAADTASGSVFRSATPLTWTYPVPFAATPSASAHQVDIASNRWPTVGAITTSNLTITAWTSIMSATAVAYGATAIGNWF